MGPATSSNYINFQDRVGLLAAGVTMHLSTGNPPIAVIAGELTWPEFPIELYQFIHKSFQGDWWYRTAPDPDALSAPALFRAVCAARLPLVLKSGIDVEPVDSMLWADRKLHGDTIKYGQLGYGRAAGSSESYTGFKDMFIMALDPKQLSRSWISLPWDATEEQINTVQARYPHRHSLPNGDCLFSMHSLPGRGIYADELEAGFWVSGDPKRAVKGIVLLGTSSERMLAQLAELGVECRRVR